MPVRRGLRHAHRQHPHNTFDELIVRALLNGRYRVEEPIGRGGMSTVYMAFDTTLERPVAIKMMHRDVARDADQLERFRREAKAIAKLSSPYVVGVIDAGEEDHTPYIVLEYVDGETLKERIRRLERLPVPEAVAYAIEVARGLQAAHDRHIVHRDVKPQNVLLDEDGAARVTDFGIARSLTEEGLTADGRVLGTTDYVSPEQALGHTVTPQSDLYSLGVVLFEMLTGDVPFHGENQVAVAMHHVRDDMPDVQRGAARGLQRARRRSSTARRRRSLDERYRRRGELIADLEDALAIETSRSGQLTGEATTVFQSLPEGKRRRVRRRIQHPWRWLAAIAALAVDRRGAVRAARPARRARHGDADAQAGAGTRARSRSARARRRTTTRSAATGSTRCRPAPHSTATRSTFWSTETYHEREPATSRASGSSSTPAERDRGRRLDRDAVTPGWTGAVYAAPRGSCRRRSPTRPGSGSASIAGGQAHARASTLDTAGRAFRWYLDLDHEVRAGPGAREDRRDHDVQVGHAGGGCRSVVLRTGSGAPARGARARSRTSRSQRSG